MSVVVENSAQPLASYPHARKVGNWLYVSGVSARRFDNTIEGFYEDGRMDIKEQTRAVILNIEKIIKAAGGKGLENIVDLTVFLVDMKDYAEFNQTYNEYFNAQSGPSRTTVAVKQLPSPKLNIEIKAVAFIK